jgi:hypothetical protein
LGLLLVVEIKDSISFNPNFSHHRDILIESP